MDGPSSQRSVIIVGKKPPATSGVELVIKLRRSYQPGGWNSKAEPHPPVRNARIEELLSLRDETERIVEGGGGGLRVEDHLLEAEDPRLRQQLFHQEPPPPSSAVPGKQRDPADLPRAGGGLVEARRPHHPAVRNHDPV